MTPFRSYWPQRSAGGIRLSPRPIKWLPRTGLVDKRPDERVGSNYLRGYQGR